MLYKMGIWVRSKSCTTKSRKLVQDGFIVPGADHDTQDVESCTRWTVHCSGAMPFDCRTDMVYKECKMMYNVKKSWGAAEAVVGSSGVNGLMVSARQ